jgi:hypothetical protein
MASRMSRGVLGLLPNPPSVEGLIEENGEV